MRAAVAVCALWAACKKPASTADPVELPVDDQGVGEERVVEVRPGRWSGGGLSVYVPPGWSGREGPAPRLMRVEHEVTGVAVELWVFSSAMDGPRIVEGQDCDFVDRSAHRAVPALGATHTATCADEAFTRQVWWATAHGREVHVEVVTPRGRAIRGRQEVAPMLLDLTVGPPP